jgi:hypothetical protein
MRLPRYLIPVGLVLLLVVFGFGIHRALREDPDLKPVATGYEPSPDVPTSLEVAEYELPGSNATKEKL